MDELQNLRHHKLGSSGFRADTGPFIGSSHKIKLEEIEQDPLANFAYALMAPGTKRHYTAKLKVFFDHAGLEGSFEKQARDFVRRAMQDNAWALSSLMKFLVFQKERQARGEITAGTVANYFKPVKLFCEMNDIVLRWKKIRVGLPRAMQASSDRAPTVDELRKICNYPDRRMRAIVCLMTSSGIRLGAWDYIRWGHIKPVVSNGQVVAARLVVYPQTPDEYTTFLTPEAYDAVKSWIDYRAEKGERITDDTWVMRDLWECENPRRNGNISGKARVQRYQEACRACALGPGCAKKAGTWQEKARVQGRPWLSQVLQDKSRAGNEANQCRVPHGSLDWCFRFVLSSDRSGNFGRLSQSSSVAADL